MARPHDFTGQQFGRWTVIERKGTDGRNSLWLCRCNCGNERIVPACNLRQGKSQGCGCLRSAIAKKRFTTHGYSTRHFYRTEYGIWAAMLRRCLNPNAPEYKNYGRRGISVCARWEKFSNFLADMGARPPGLTLDRIDNNGHYEPSNCRWATRTEQARNSRNTRFIVYEGERVLLIEAIARSGLTYSAVMTRIHRGWPEDKWFIPTR